MDSRVSAMIRHYISMDAEEINWRLISDKPDKFDKACHSPFWLMARAKKLEPARFELFLAGVSSN